MKQRFETVIAHIAEWSPNRNRRKLDDFQPEFMYESVQDCIDAVIRIPAGSAIKTELQGDENERRYLVYPDFIFRPGLF